jgi:hypothetical protein
MFRLVEPLGVAFPMASGGGSTGVVTLISDTFTDTNATALASHVIAPTNTPAASWTVDVGAITISSNKAIATENSRSSADAGIADGSVSASMQMTSNGTDSSMGVAGRVTDASNLWVARLYNGNFDLVEVNAGVFTARDTDAFAHAANTDYLIKIVFNGTSITATVDGGTTLTYTSSFSQAATKHGLYLYGDSGATARADNFTVTNATS